MYPYPAPGKSGPTSPASLEDAADWKEVANIVTRHGITVSGATYFGADTWLSLDREVSLGRFSFTLTRADIVSYPYGDKLRVYVDMGPAGAETFHSFSLSSADLSKMEAWHWKTSETTGRMEYFKLPLEGIKRRVKLTFTGPVYAVEGPWTFTFPVNQTHN